MMTFFEADVFKALPAIDGFVQAIAPAGAIAIGRFARADPDDVWVLLVDRHSANRAGACFVEDGFPGDTAVFAEEYAA